MNTTQILAEINKLSFDELKLLHAGFVQIYKRKQLHTQLDAGGNFHPGQIVKFTGSKGRARGRIIYIKITGFNRAGTCAVGPECDKNGIEVPFSPKWTVANSIISLVK